jgi:radical SAM superfamily enzyme YgiQ (UPF0313 family)
LTTQRTIRIALISPKGPLYRHRGGIFGRGLRYMPLTFPVLASLIPEEMDVELRCIDEGIECVPDDLEADLVGMTLLTGSAMRAYELSSALRSRGIPVVMGGPHVTLIPDDAQPHADAIVVGYAEDTWPRLLRDVQSGTLKPRYDQDPELSLADRPLPDRSVLPRRKYLTSHVYEATRGCIHDCDFCVVPSAWGRKPLQHPVEDLVADLRRNRTKRAVFIDLNIIADHAYAQALFAALIPLKLQWYGLATTLLCKDLPLLDLAAKSGCRGLLMGLESISQANLRHSRKGFNRPEDYANVVNRLHERGIGLQGCFVFGLDGDEPDVFEKTADFAVQAGIDLPRFAIVTPFPGTSLYRRLESEDRIITRNWDLYDGQHAVFQPARMSIDELQAGTERAWLTAYSWSGIGRRLRQAAAPWPVALVTNLGYRRYAKRLRKFYHCGGMLAPDWLHDMADRGGAVQLTIEGLAKRST